MPHASGKPFPFRSRVRCALTVLLVSAMFPAGFRLRAQETVAAPPPSAASAKEAEQEPVVLDQFVVSGTVAPRRNLESAAAVTTIDFEQIKISVPRGAPDLIKLVPGMYVESAGGEARSNVYTRGIPQTGGFAFAGLQEDGLPVISETGIRNTTPDFYTRLTSLVSRVESVRGGTAGVFQNNAPGGIINFITREGAAVRQGEFAVQTSDYNQLKGELWTAGPLAADTTYAFYAGYRRDDGQRRTGYTANAGGAVIANVKHTFANDRGYVKVSAKWMDERNAFYVPVPLRNARDPQGIPGGIDIRTGTILSADLRRGVSIPTTPDGPLNPDLADGIHVPLAYVGADLEFKLTDHLKLKDLSRYTTLDYHQAYLLLSSVATPLQTLANSIASAAGTQFAAARANGNYRYRVSFPGATGVAVADPAALNGNGLGVLQTMSTAAYKVTNFQNDLRLLQSLGGGVSLAGGLYMAELKTTAHNWGHTLLTEVHDNPRRLDVEYLDATTGASLGYGTYHGIRQVSAAGSYRNNTASQQNLAPYFNAELALGNWTFDSGVRHEQKKENVTVAVPQAYDLNAAGQSNPALRNATFGNGATYHADFDIAATVWTGAANYKFNKHLSAYVRAVDAYRMPISDDFMLAALARSADPGPINRIRQLEAGVKYSTRKVAVFATVIDSSLKNQLFAGTFAQPDGSLITRNYFRDTAGYGLEIEAFVTPIKSLSFHFVGTEQRMHFANDSFVTALDSSGHSVALNINGNRPVRIPNRFFTASVVYRLPEASFGQVVTNLDWEYVGERAGDEANRILLPAYSQIALGLSLKSGRITYRAQVQNLFNTIGFTEGDPRTALLVGDPNAAYLNARTIMPRSIVASVNYAF